MASSSPQVTDSDAEKSSSATPSKSFSVVLLLTSTTTTSTPFPAITALTSPASPMPLVYYFAEFVHSFAELSLSFPEFILVCEIICSSKPGVCLYLLSSWASSYS